jgi:hypothetical protein
MWSHQVLPNEGVARVNQHKVKKEHVMRCCICDYCNTTESLVSEKVNLMHRRILFDEDSQQHYCEKCINEWNITLSEYTLVLESNREIDNDN